MYFYHHAFKRWQWVLIQRVWYLLCWEMESCYGDKAAWQLVILNLVQLGSKKRLSIFRKETWLPCSISQDQVREEKCKTMRKAQKLDDARNILSWGSCIPTLLLAPLKSLLGCSDTAEARESQKDLCHCYCLWCLSYLLPDEPKVSSLAFLCCWASPTSVGAGTGDTWATCGDYGRRRKPQEQLRLGRCCACHLAPGKASPEPDWYWHPLVLRARGAGCFRGALIDWGHAVLSYLAFWRAILAGWSP